MKRVLLGILMSICVCSIYIIYENSGEINYTETVNSKLAHDFIQLDSGMTHYQVSGDPAAPLVVLLHGFSIPSFLWEMQFDFLVKSGLRVLRYDQLGRGLSERPKGKLTLGLLTRQLNELLEVLKIKKVSIVGHSMGSALGAFFTSLYPERVEHLILSAPIYDLLKLQSLKKLARIPYIGDIGIQILGPLYIKRRAYSLLDKVDNSRMTELFELQWRTKGYLHSLLSIMRNDMFDSHEKSYLKIATTNVPVAIIRGLHDKIFPLRVSEKIKAIIPRVKVYTLDAGHGLNFSKFKEYNSALIDFLKK